MSSFSNHQQQQSRFLANASTVRDTHPTTDTTSAKSKQKQSDEKSKGAKQNAPSPLIPPPLSNGPGDLQPSTHALKYTYVRSVLDSYDEIWSDDRRVFKMDILVPSTAFTGEQNRELRGRNQEDIYFQFRKLSAKVLRFFIPHLTYDDPGNTG